MHDTLHIMITSIKLNTNYNICIQYTTIIGEVIHEFF